LKTENLNKILIIRLSSLGDVILVSYLARLLKKQYPKAEISILTGFPEVLEFNPNIDNIYVYVKSKQNQYIKLFKKEEGNKLKINDFDFVIDLQNNNRSKQILSGFNGKLFKYNKNRLEKLRIVYTKYKPKNISPIPIRYAETAKELNIEDDKLGLEFFLAKPQTKNNKLISIAIGAKHFTKRYPFEKYLEVSKELIALGYEIAFLGGKEDLEHIDSNKIKDLQIDNLIGMLTIQETANKIAESKLLISNDSALMHIAAGLQVPIVAIFGSTTQDLGFAPFRVAHKVIEVNLSCRPCSHIGKSKCPKKHFNCMMLISPKMIVDSAISLIN